MPSVVPSAKERTKPTPTRKIDHGRVWPMMSLTGTPFAVEKPKSPVKMFPM